VKKTLAKVKKIVYSSLYRWTNISNRLLNKVFFLEMLIWIC